MAADDARDERNNVTLVGKTGSGKSRTAMQLALERLAAGKLVVILSATSEYYEWCQEHGGRYTTLWAGDQDDSQRFGNARLFVTELDRELSRPWQGDDWDQGTGWSYSKKGGLLILDDVRRVFDMCPQSYKLVNTFYDSRADFWFLGQAEDDADDISAWIRPSALISLKTLEIERGQLPRPVPRVIVPRV